MKWFIVPAVLAGLFAVAGPAQSQSMTGCWHYTDGSTVFSSVCLNGSGGTFNLEYAIEDPSQGLVKGSCNGAVEIRGQDGGAISFTVPYQENACRQEEAVFRVAKRDYDCQRQGPAMVCTETVYYDNGQIFSQQQGLQFGR